VAARAPRPTPPPGEGPPVWAVMSPARVDHVRRVAELLAQWAGARDLPALERARWLRAAWLHDALRDADPAALAGHAPDASLPAALLHGPAAAARAMVDGERDAGVLDAVRYHSVGWPEWDGVGRALYCADFLDPGRAFDAERRAELAQRYPEAPDEVLITVARLRLAHLVRSGWPLLDPTVRFWNRLVPRLT
jgi:HD superfamily phosphohydrolase YqeK